ncbi:MAG: protein-glutamate O-methyltransferase CheR [Nitrospirota bacterium]|nr:protein-glutamate O-methyltransferase CheR [Nitrospirota bacterium]
MSDERPIDAGPVLSAEAFQVLQELVRDACGIMIPDNRNSALEARLAEQMAKLGLDSYRDYLDRLQRTPYSSPLWQELFHHISTNETYFFRNQSQNQVFAEHLLPRVLKRQEGRLFKRLKVWSAACATGEEAYTLAIQILDALGSKAADWQPQVVGTDIDAEAIRVAEGGTYSGRSLQYVPHRVLKRHFDKDGNTYKVDEKVRQMVSFKVVNFASEAEMATQINMDVIFCRNVLIYFDGEFRKRVVDRLYHSLKPGGYLVIGHSESLRGVHTGFDAVQFPGTHVYQRPEE